MQERGVRVRGVLGVHGAFVVDECVGGDIWGDDKRRDAGTCQQFVCQLSHRKSVLPNTETSEVVGDIVALGNSSERDLVFWLGDVDWRRNVVREASMFIEVDDNQARASTILVIVSTQTLGVRKTYTLSQYFDFRTAS